MAFNPSRREFLIGSATLAAGLALPDSAKAQGSKRGDKVRFAVIGVGGRGGANLASAGQYGEVVALCDIEAERRAKSLIEYPDASTFADYREMLEAVRNQVDAVVVSTPDHNHAPAAAMAMSFGKHVYCEKPLTRTIYEARRLAEIAKSKKVVTQMGNQGTANTSLRKAAALIKSGAFGAVKEVHCWTDRADGWWAQGVDRPAPMPTPKGIDWDAWIGPSPFRPYAPGYHPFQWRGWWDFGSGSLGDIGCHCMNLPFMALDLREPTAVTAKTSGHNKDSFPNWSIVTYEFPKRGDRPALTLYWYDGGKKPPKELAPGMDYPGNGCILVCERATLFSPEPYGDGIRIVGGGEVPAIQVEESPGHFAEFVNAIKDGGRAKSDFTAYSGPLTETVLLGNLAIWADGPRVEWDARRMRVPGHPEYDSLIKPVYRPGWTL